MLMIVDAFIYIKKQSFTNAFKNAFSLCNILAVLVILPVFYLFFKCNVAANGDADNGGFGLYVPFSDFTVKRVVVLLLFYLEEFGLYAIFLYKENKSKTLYWAVIISLILIPNFKIGIAHDFCMRACIPALFILMLMVLEYFYKIYDGILKTDVCTILLIISLSIASLATVMDYLVDIKTIRTSQQFPYLEDNVVTFSHRPVYDDPEIFYTINFLSPNPAEKIFFKYLAK